MVQFDRVQFDTALTLVTQAKLRGLKNLGLIKIKVELDALTNGIYPEISFVTETGKHYEYIGDDFVQGMDALRKLSAKASQEAEGNGKAQKPAAGR